MSAASDNYIPRPDGDFDGWSAQFYDALDTWWNGHGLDPAELVPVKQALLEWQGAYPAHVSARAAAQAARETKDAARKLFESRARPLVKIVQAFPQTTAADRAEMGITVYQASPPPPPVPASAPRLLVNQAARLSHVLRLSDAESPTRRARPRGASRAELFVAFSDTHAPAPENPRDYRYVQSITAGTARLSFEPQRAGQTAHYLARWIGGGGGSGARAGQQPPAGPWSEAVSATIAA